MNEVVELMRQLSLAHERIASLEAALIEVCGIAEELDDLLIEHGADPRDAGPRARLAALRQIAMGK